MLNRDNGEVVIKTRDNSYAGRLKRLEAKVSELQDVVEILMAKNPTDEWNPKKKED